MKLPETEQEFIEPKDSYFFRKLKDGDLRKYSIDDRQNAFCKHIQQWIVTNKREKDYPLWLAVDFCEFWCGLKNDGGWKMKFECERSWETGGRLATAKRIVYSKDSRWKTTEPKKDNVDHYRSKRAQKQQIHNQEDYFEKLRKKWSA